MKRFVILLAAILGLCVAYLLAHWALIEVGREVIVLRTQEADGGWFESRLWIVDDGAVSWLHGADSHWMRNLKARPIVEIARSGGVSDHVQMRDFLPSVTDACSCFKPDIFLV